MTRTMSATSTSGLAGLHDPAWWTGLSLGHDPELPSMEFRVRLVTADGNLLFNHLSAEWIQASHVWMPLPWAIPAAMATTMGLLLEITVLSASSDALFLITTVGFHEMRGLPVKDRYLFVSETGEAVGHWIGASKVWAHSALAVRSLYRVVPPVSLLIEEDNEKENSKEKDQLFCIHDWSERVTL